MQWLDDSDGEPQPRQVDVFEVVAYAVLIGILLVLIWVAG